MKTKVPVILVRMGHGRSVLCYEQPDGAVALCLRRPIQREHVENGCIIQQNLFSRDGTKRVATVLLDETSAEATYQVLSAWRKKKRRDIREQVLFNYLFMVMARYMERRLFFSRWK